MVATETSATADMSFFMQSPYILGSNHLGLIYLLIRLGGDRKRFLIGIGGTLLKVTPAYSKTLKQQRSVLVIAPIGV